MTPLPKNVRPNQSLILYKKAIKSSVKSSKILFLSAHFLNFFEMGLKVHSLRNLVLIMGIRGILIEKYSRNKFKMDNVTEIRK